jgi:[acyl-carrier-protein] S-malonyltransferase
MFPGHGGQFVGMARDLFRKHPTAVEVAEQAERASGLPLRRIATVGPVDELTRPEVLEPLLTASAIAYVDILTQSGRRPSAVAGYSAGEVAACYAAGVLGRGEAILASVWRGELLREAAGEFLGGMVAVLKLEFPAVERAVKAARDEGAAVSIAGENAPAHTTVSGLDSDLATLAATLARLGGEVRPIPVAGPWHGPWLTTATLGLVEKLRGLPFARPGVTLYSAVTGRPEDDPDRLRGGLAATLSRTVQWRFVVDDLRRRGFRQYLEIGSGRVLRDFLRRHPPDGPVDLIEGVEGHDGGDAPLRRQTAIPSTPPLWRIS